MTTCMGNILVTWLSLVMSLMAFFFVLSFFPHDVLDEIWDLIESVSEGSCLLLRVVDKKRIYQTNKYIKDLTVRGCMMTSCEITSDSNLRFRHLEQHVQSLKVFFFRIGVKLTKD